MGWPERGQLAAPGARVPVRVCLQHARQGVELSGGTLLTIPTVGPDQCQVCHPAAPLTYSLERQLQIERALADADHHDEGTGYCTGLPDHGDELHPHPESARHLAPGVPAELDPLGQAAADLAPGCGCPVADGAIRHQRGTCTDPVTASVQWFADDPAAPAGQSDDDARADQIACARDLQELAARNLAAAGEDLAEARRAVAEAQQECDQAAAALSRVDPGAPPFRTVADIRGQVEKWEDTYTKTAAGLREGSARESMRAAAGAMLSVLRYIDGEY